MIQGERLEQRTYRTQLWIAPREFGISSQVQAARCLLEERHDELDQGEESILGDSLLMSREDSRKAPVGE